MRSLIHIHRLKLFFGYCRSWRMVISSYRSSPSVRRVCLLFVLDVVQENPPRLNWTPLRCTLSNKQWSLCLALRVICTSSPPASSAMLRQWSGMQWTTNFVSIRFWVSTDYSFACYTKLFIPSFLISCRDFPHISFRDPLNFSKPRLRFAQYEQII